MTSMAESDVDIEALWTRYAPLVVRRCRQLLKDEDEAVDVAQDVFVELLRRQATLRIDYPSSFLYRTATNRCLNRIRDRRQEPEYRSPEALAAVAAAGDPAAGVDARLDLEHLFGRHRWSTRSIAILHLLDGLTLDEVAHRVGLSVSGVRKRLRSLRATLQRMEGR